MNRKGDENIKILHVSASLSPEWGGPTKVVVELTEALARKGIDITIFTPVRKGDEVKIKPPKGVNLQLFNQGFLSKWWTSYSPDLARNIQWGAYKFDLIHIHEIWHYANFASYHAAKKAGKPYIITIHGLLDPWCLNYKAFKKKIYSLFIQRRILREASALHAITNEEVKHIRTFGIDSSIVMIPNGIDPKEFINLPPREELESFYPKIKGKRIILFLGRIHPKKGLDLLAKAFEKIAREWDNAYLMIVGPDSEGYKIKIEKMLESEGVLNKVIFTGMLSGRKKLIVLGGADIFALPSYSEGFSMAILEAMICKLPVIITKQCNFPEVTEVGAGNEIDPNVEQLTGALSNLLGNPELCKKMGEKGRKLVLEKYTWDKTADKMIKVYEEIVNRKGGM